MKNITGKIYAAFGYESYRNPAIDFYARLREKMDEMREKIRGENNGIRGWIEGYRRNFWKVGEVYRVIEGFKGEKFEKVIDAVYAKYTAPFSEIAAEAYANVLSYLNLAKRE